MSERPQHGVQPILLSNDNPLGAIRRSFEAVLSLLLSMACVSIYDEMLSIDRSRLSGDVFDSRVLDS